MKKNLESRHRSWRSRWLIAGAILGVLIVALALWSRRYPLLVNFEWTRQGGFTGTIIHFEHFPSGIFSRSIDPLLVMQAKPHIAREFEKAGWHRAQGQIAIMTLGHLPLVLGLDPRVHWKIIDPEESPLMLAADACDAERVKALLARGDDPNAQDQQGYTALMRAARNYRQACVEVVRQLLTARVNLNEKDHFGRTALHYAVYDGIRLDIVKLLVKAGADVNTVDKKGKAVLLEAIASGPNEDQSRETAKILIDAGANIYAMNAEGETALELAARLHQNSIVTMLREAGATH